MDEKQAKISFYLSQEDSIQAICYFIEIATE